MNVYFISGLGADESAFDRIKLPEGFEAIHLNWIPPLENESMNAYAQRMSTRINTNEDFILVGLSMGGMIACEMNKFIHPKKTILISSAATRKELPHWIRLAGKLKMHRMVPFVINKERNFVLAKILGAKTREEVEKVAKMRKATPKDFSVWAIREIISWSNDQEPENFIHLHGTSDLLLTYRKNRKTIPVKGGSHLMVFNRAEEVNELLARHLIKHDK